MLYEAHFHITALLCRDQKYYHATCFAQLTNHAAMQFAWLALNSKKQVECVLNFD